MQVETLDDDVLMFRGVAYESIATAFIDGRDVLLVDALASLPDALAMRSYLEVTRGAYVRTIVLTHGGADHRAGLDLFPEARVRAHPRAADLMRAAPNDSPAATEAIVERIEPILDGEEASFGRHALCFFHNEGKTPCTVGIEAGSSDLLFTGDNLLGQIAYLSRSTPELIRRGIDRLESRSGSRLVEGHQGVFPRASIPVVRHYLQNLEKQVRKARLGSPADASPSILTIRIEDCLPPDVVPSKFEREWHGQNLAQIRSRNLYAERMRDA